MLPKIVIVHSGIKESRVASIVKLLYKYVDTNRYRISWIDLNKDSSCPIKENDYPIWIMDDATELLASKFEKYKHIEGMYVENNYCPDPEANCYFLEKFNSDALPPKLLRSTTSITSDETVLGQPLKYTLSTYDFVDTNQSSSISGCSASSPKTKSRISML